ncbi:unnamed protein product, partial [Medioppia subpectinata]
SPQFAIPTPGVQPVFTQYFTRGNGQDIELQPQSAPLSPPSNNLVWAQQQREPIAQQQLLDFFHPTQQPLVFEAPATRPIQLFSSLDNSGLSYFPEQQPQQQLREHQPQPFGGYTLVLQHREAGQQRQVSAPQTPSEPQIIEQEKVSEERTESQEQQLRPIAAQQTVVPTVPLRQAIEYRPLPVLQRQEPLVFEPQVTVDSTRPHTLTLNEHTFPTVGDHNSDHNSYTNNREKSRKESVESPEYQSYFNSNNSVNDLSADESIVVLRRQVKALSRRVSAKELDNQYRHQREVLIYTLGVIYFVVKGFVWIHRQL